MNRVELGPRDLSRKQFWLGLALCYGIHLIIVSLYLFDVIPQQFHSHERLFHFHHGGDQLMYFELAQGILAGDPPATYFPVGLPLLLLPFLAVVRPETAQDLIGPVAAFWGLVMFGVGQWILARLGERVMASRVLALAAVFVWSSLPLFIYGLCRLVGSAAFAEVNSVHLTWMQMLSDGPSTLMTLLSMLAFFWAMDKPGGGARWAVVGALTGFGVLVRTSAALTPAVLVVALVFERRWRALAPMGVGASLAYVPQLVYNASVFGNPLLHGYGVVRTSPFADLIGVGYLASGAEILWERIGLLLPVLVLFSLAVVFWGTIRLWKVYPTGGLVVTLWFWSFVVPYSVFIYSWEGNLARYLMPAYPAGAILLAAAIGGLFETATAHPRASQGS